MKKVLVIEADPQVSWLLERMLRGKYYVVLVNNTADARMWLAEGNTCDAIVLDTNATADECVSMADQLGSDFLTRNIPLMILSASEESRSVCLGMGASAFVVKKEEPQRLLGEVRTGIESMCEVVSVPADEKK